MKCSLKIHIKILLIGGIFFCTSCCLPCMDDPPTVTTTNVSDITQTSTGSGGNVTNNGGNEVTSRGVCWSTTPNPTTSLSKTSDGKGNGSFTSRITGLTANTNYYVRAYATNGVGTGYGNEIRFTTKP
jgi:hypothetical protein